MPHMRKNETTTATIANGENLSGAIDMCLYSMMVVHMDSEWTAASIGFKVATAEDGAYLPLYDDDGNLVQIDAPTAGKAYASPAALAGARFVKLWSQNGTGTDVNQGAARTLGIDLKA
jgi:hypothetical protein